MTDKEKIKSLKIENEDLKEALKYARKTRNEYFKDIVKLRDIILKNCDDKTINKMLKMLQPEFQDDE
jgi:biotin synthase-like enzyme